MNKSIFILLTLFLVSACSDVADMANSEQQDSTQTSVEPLDATKGSSGYLLSAFYGLDGAFGLLSGFFICDGARGMDGMPVIFSHQLDISTIQAEDFEVALADGGAGHVTCATPAPATDTGELRTILLVGDFGSITNQPVTVSVGGNILSLDGDINFRGSSVDVIPLEQGPSLIYAEVVPEVEWELGKEATRFRFGGGSGCPEETRQVVRVVWTGGVTKPGGDAIDEKERLAYNVKVDDGEGGLADVVPFAIGDLGDRDNNHELCLDVEGAPVSVQFPAGLVTDPRDDLNPATTVQVAPAG